MFSLFARVKNLLLSPGAEWEKIDTEAVKPGQLVLRYVAPLAFIPALATFVGLAVLGVEVGGERHRAPIPAMAASSALFVALTAGGVYVFAWILNRLAPGFGAKQSYPQAFKVAAYSLTAAMIAGAVTVIPALGVFALLGATYSAYLLFIGAPKVMHPAPESSVNYAIVATGSAIVLALGVGLAAMGAASVSGGMFPNLVRLPDFAALNPGASSQASLQSTVAASAAPQPKVRYGDDAGAASGDLKEAAPLMLEGLDRVAAGALKSGVDGDRTVSVDAEYRKGRRYIVLQITLSDSIARVIGFGGPATSEFDRETADGYSRRKREGEAIVVEDWNEGSQTGSYGRLTGDKFYVRAQGGGGVKPLELKRAVEAFGEETQQRLAAAL
jgi:hypothetical protein